jgi:hypothetical protein
LQIKFRLTSLLLFTAYFAVAAWLVSLGLAYAVFVWTSTVFGLEIGKRSDYSTILITLCGSVMGLALLFAVIATRFSLSSVTWGGPRSGVEISLAAMAWVMVLSILLWLCFRVKRKSIP